MQPAHQFGGKGKKKKSKNDVAASEAASGSNNNNKKEKFPPCNHCGGKSHPYFKCWRWPDAKCNNCNQMGHEVVICKAKVQ